jgi:hypothetical protein
VVVIALKRSKTCVFLHADQPLTCGCFFFRIARRDNAKRRHEQKNEEKNSAIRKRASEVKEKEKVRVNSCFYYCAFPAQPQLCMLRRLLWICSNSWRNSALDNDHAFMYGARTMSFEGVFQRCIPAYSDYRHYGIQSIYIVHSRPIRLGEMLPGDKKEDRYDDACDGMNR